MHAVLFGLNRLLNQEDSDQYNGVVDKSSMASVDTIQSKKLFVFNYDDVVYPRDDYFQNTGRSYYPCINAPFVNPPYWKLSTGETRVHGAY